MEKACDKGVTSLHKANFKRASNYPFTQCTKRILRLNNVSTFLSPLEREHV